MIVTVVFCQPPESFSELEMEGQLSAHPLGELISEISEKGFSGALRIERERIRAVVYFEQGALVYATSNLRVHRLAEYLHQQGLTGAAFNEAASDVAIAEELLAKGLLTRQRLDELLTELVTSIMRVMLLWTDGAWGFDGRARLSESIQVKVATQQLLLEATRRLDLNVAAARFSHGGEEIILALNPPDGLNLLPTEGFLLSRVEDKISLDDFIALSGLPEPDAKQVIYGLLMAGLLKRQFWQPAFRTAPPQIESDKTKSDATSKAPVPPAKTPTPAEAIPDPRRELDAFLERLASASNHYEVLNVSLAADLPEIKRVYHTIARNFHPDRFHDLAGSFAHTRLQSGFARVTQAYESLTNPELRAAYDAHMRALKKIRETHEPLVRTGATATPSQGAGESENGNDVFQLAEKRFQEGAAALQQGQTNAATSCFSAAARLAPKEAKYRAYFGRSLAANPKTRREAENELQAAVKLDPANASYHVMLAVLYRDLGFSRRAASEVERALALDPQNPQARQLLGTLEQK